MLFEKPRVFLSYSHKDQAFRDELVAHLRLLERNNTIECWHDRKIAPGADWARDIDERLDSSDIVLLLVSSDFLASDYCFEKELAQAQEQHRHGRTILIPVIVRPCIWQQSNLKELQALPRDAKPITKWEDRDEAWKSVVEGVLDAVHQTIGRKTVFREDLFPLCDESMLKAEGLIADDDGKLARNLSRLERKDEALAQKIRDYISGYSAWTALYREKADECYRLLFSGLGSFALPAVSTSVTEVLQGLQECLFKELDIISDLEQLHIAPSGFGLNKDTIDLLKDTRKIMEQTMKVLTGFHGVLKNLREEVMDPLTDIGAREAGEDYEE